MTGAESPEPAGSGWAGGRYGERSCCVLAGNASPMTLDGTNTWVLREPGARRSVVVDPGPLEREHLARVLETASPVAVVLLTHGHADHSAGARDFAERAACGVRALDPLHRLGTLGLHDEDVVEVDGLEIQVVATPGHTSDSLSFVLPGDRAVLTGDTVLGRGTTVVAHPDGRLGAYLSSLHRLRGLVQAAEVATVLPGHGPVLENAAAVLDYYLAHRRERLDEVRQAVAQGTSDAAAIVRTVYSDVDPRLWPAAELSVRAQLAYLREA